MVHAEDKQGEGKEKAKSEAEQSKTESSSEDDSSEDERGARGLPESFFPAMHPSEKDPGTDPDDPPTLGSPEDTEKNNKSH